MFTCSMHLGRSLALSELFPHRYWRNKWSPSELGLKLISPVGMAVAWVYEVRLDLMYHPIEGPFTDSSGCLKVTWELRVILWYLG